MKHIHSYYSPNDLYSKIIAGLNEIGMDLSKVTLDEERVSLIETVAIKPNN